MKRSTTWTYALINAAFIAAGAAMAALTLCPVFETARLVTVAAVAIGTGALIAVLCDRRGWSGFVAAGLAAAGRA